MSAEGAYKLVLPDDFDEYSWEVESKGVFWGARLEYNGLEYPITFYEPHRLAQDVAEELKGRPLFFESNIVVVRKVTKDAMESAAEDLIRRGEMVRMQSNRSS